MSNVDPSRTALLIIDPQNDLLSEGGVMWDMVGEGVKNRKVVEHLVELRNAARMANVPIFYSPHRFSDYELATWKRLNVIDKLMFDRRTSRKPGWGADFHPCLVPDESTFILSAHKAGSGFWGVDISIQFSQRGIETIILAGTSANLCMTSNLRHAEARDYEVLLVKDATTGPANQEIQAALARYGRNADEVVTTDEITNRLHEVGAATKVRRVASAITPLHFPVRVAEANSTIIARTDPATKFKGARR